MSCHAVQEEVLARSQSKQFYQHLITLFQQLKTCLVTSRPCFLLPRPGGSSSLLAVSCALDDDLAYADESSLSQQALSMSLTSEPSIQARSSEAGGSPPAANRLGSYNIFSATSPGNSTGKPGLGVFVGGGGSSSGPAFVVSAGPHQVLLPPESAEGEL